MCSKCSLVSCRDGKGPQCTKGGELQLMYVARCAAHAGPGWCSTTSKASCEAGQLAPRQLPHMLSTSSCRDQDL